jgi:hypothetical protein
MPTECSANAMAFAPVDGRRVVADFAGGAITSNAGALLLAATDRTIALIERFAACFTDGRASDRVVHDLSTLVGQRVLGIALGYEDLVDHDQLRHDPVMGVVLGRLEARHGRCAPLAGKSTLNRLELGTAVIDRYCRIAHEPPLIERLLVDLFLDAHGKAAQGDRARSRCDRRSAARPSGRPLLPRLLRLPLLFAALRLLRPASFGGQAAPLEHRCLCRFGRGGGTDRRADPRALAKDQDRPARRQEAQDLALGQLYRALDLLAEHGDAIEQEVFWRSVDLFKLDVDLVFYDATTAWFETDETDVASHEWRGLTFDPLRQRGHSKEGRDNDPQVVIALAVTRDGIPVRSWIFPGNTPDVATVARVKDDLRDMRLGRTLFVGDAGLYSKANLEELAKGAGKYILATPIRRIKEISPATRVSSTTSPSSSLGPSTTPRRPASRRVASPTSAGPPRESWSRRRRVVAKAEWMPGRGDIYCARWL